MFIYYRQTRFDTGSFGRAVTRSSLGLEVWRSNLGLAKSDTELPTVHNHCNISSKKAVLPARVQQRGDGPRKLVTRFGVVQRVQRKISADTGNPTPNDSDEIDNDISLSFEQLFVNMALSITT